MAVDERKGLIIFDDSDQPVTGAKIKVIGIGGGGGNAINRMIEAGIEGVQFLVANTDLQALKSSRASRTLILSGKLVACRQTPDSIFDLIHLDSGIEAQN